MRVNLLFTLSASSRQAFAAMNSWQTGEYTGTDMNYGIDWAQAAHHQA